MMDRSAFDALQAEVAADGAYLDDLIANADEVAALADGTVEELLVVLADELAAQAVAVEFVALVEPFVTD